MRKLVFLLLTSLVSCEWNVEQRTITKNNESYRVAGMSWFGFETQDFVLDGLWSHPMEFYLDILSNHQINTLRIPYSAEWIHYNWNLYPYSGLVTSSPKDQGKTSIEILDRLFEETEKRNMSIMLDLHRLHKEYISPLWYSPFDAQYTSETFFDTWFAMLDRYHDRSNLFAIDLLNEPHGEATWGSGSVSTDWALFVRSAVPRIRQRYPASSWLIFVEGIGWGKDLSGARDTPVHHVDERMVYSPHSYGKSVVPSVDTGNVGALRWDWDRNFGFLTDMGCMVVPGEWGGRTDIDEEWMRIWVDYLKEKGVRDSFFWSLGPNSGDVAGFLYDDWTTVDPFKAELVQSLSFG